MAYLIRAARSSLVCILYVCHAVNERHTAVEDNWKMTKSDPIPLTDQTQLVSNAVARERETGTTYPYLITFSTEKSGNFNTSFRPYFKISFSTGTRIRFQCLSVSAFIFLLIENPNQYLISFITVNRRRSIISSRSIAPVLNFFHYGKP